MSSINLYTREINIKTVYYGPGLGGKTTSLQHIHKALRPDLRGRLVSLATDVDRTLFFDFLPVKIPKIKDFTIRLSLYTVPGQVHYNATRQLVLQGADGVVFVADSQTAREEANIESLRNLEDNLRGQGLNPEAVPLVLQYNKRDLKDILQVEELQAELNQRNLPHFETCALTGQGIFKALKKITRIVLADLKKKGIYQDKPTERPAPSFGDAPVVQPGVETSLVQALDTQPEPAPASPAPVPKDPTPPEVIDLGLTFTELWESGPAREQILSLEGDIERGEYVAAVRRAQGLLVETVGAADSDDAPAVEALLMLGVHGRHFARWREIVSRKDATKKDALFCLFFLVDIELRLQSARSTHPDVE